MGWVNEMAPLLPEMAEKMEVRPHMCDAHAHTRTHTSHH